MLHRYALAALGLLALATTSPAADGVKVGDRVGKLKFTDTRSLPRTLDDFGPKKAVVLVFTNTTCPLARKYLPTLRQLERDYRDKGVQFVAVNAAADDTLVAMATQAVTREMEFPFVKDFDGGCATALGVRRTPEAVVLDADRTIRYRGRVNDQYRLGGTRPAPTTNELRDALDAVLAGEKVAVPETEVDGCVIAPPQPVATGKATFAADVAPIVYKHCGECHVAGGSAPFPLATYQQVSARAATIAEVVTDQRMPPWFASHEFGPFVNRRGLTDAERDTLIRWAKSGAAPGDLTKLPPAPASPSTDWQIGRPDQVIRSAAFELPADGDVPYKYTVLPFVFGEGTWVQGLQIRGDNPRVLHHANLAYGNLAEGFSEKNFITGYVPGGEPVTLDDGLGVLIPKGSMLALQIHFVTTGKPEKCSVSVGLRFPRAAVDKRLRNVQLTDGKFAIPPGAPAHRVAASRVLDADVIGVGLFAHMHLRGKDMTFTAHLPDGRRDTLLVIPNYNFEWQVPYRWEPGKVRLPRGTRLECVAHFDNSAFNPYNPNPKATVRNGPQTHHEMMFGFFFYTNADEKLGVTVDPATGRVRKPN
ncbi:MAG: redoxin family protein [Gemmataceae bacterium]|nr:redoxin family protein [Gemmataceae bacterium]